MWYAKQKQPKAVKKSTPSAKQWLNMTGKNKVWYQVAAKQIGILPWSY